MFHKDFHSIQTHFHSHPPCRIIPFCPQSSLSHVNVSCNWDEVKFKGGFICIPLSPRDGEHFFISRLTICTSFFLTKYNYVTSYFPFFPCPLLWAPNLLSLKFIFCFSLTVDIHVLFFQKYINNTCSII